MATQVYYEDVKEGMELPPLVRGPITTLMIVRFDGAVENYEQLHHDYLWCKEHNFPNVLINGPLKQSLLAVLMTTWVGDGGFLRKISCSQRGMDYPGHTLTGKGKVAKKWVEDGLGYVECEIWIENQKGEITTPGRAVAILPQKGKGPVPAEFPCPRERVGWAFEP